MSDDKGIADKGHTNKCWGNFIKNFPFSQTFRIRYTVDWQPSRAVKRGAAIKNMILVLIIDFVLYKLAFFPLLLQIALSSTDGGQNRKL